MINVQHLIDHTSDVIGSDTFAALTAAAGEPYVHSQHTVNAKYPLPPGQYGDVVVLHFNASWSRLPFISLLRQDIGDRPLIIVEQTYCRDFESHCVANRNRFRRLLRLTYKLADMVVAASAPQAAWLVESKLVGADRVTTLSPPVDWTGLATVLPPEPARQGPLRLTASGTLRSENGFDVLIEAMRRLPDGVARLDITGAGDESERLRDAARSVKGVRVSQYALAPHMSLSRSDAVVVPSRWGAAAVRANEACAASRPVITTCADEGAESGATAWGESVTADSPAELADAIMRLASRPLDELGRAARMSAMATMTESQRQWTQMLRAVAP